MAEQFSDVMIQSLIMESKRLPDDFDGRLRLRQKRGHKEWDMFVEGDQHNRFRLLIRQSDYNILDFSVVLIYCPIDSNAGFRLTRYNGKSHEHTNRIEKVTFYDFHIHTATQRYQEYGGREDDYATPTDRFSDWRSALKCLLMDCGFIRSNMQDSFEELWT